MKPVSLSAFDRAILRQRSIIESVFDELKNLCQIAHTRHCSIANFRGNLMAGIIAYCLVQNKPGIPVAVVQTLQRDSSDQLNHN